MKNTYLLSLSLLSAFTMNAQNCSELFISEYVEGWSNNKAIELFNPTSETIDLSQYALSRWSNGATVALTTELSGSIGPNEAFVIGLDKRDPNGEGYEAPLWDGWLHFTDSITLLPDSIYTEESDLMSKIDLFICPNYEDGTMYFNGNDAFTLETLSSEVIDVIGKIGEDPGDGWADDNGNIWTEDHSLVRKSSVTSPFVYDPSVEYTFDPTLEWDSLPANSFSSLGTHECDCELSLEENESSMQVFPNPNASGLLNIQTTGTIEQISIYNVLGEQVFSKSYSNSSMLEKLTLSPTLKGLYFIKVNLEGNKVLLKKLLLN